MLELFLEGDFTDTLEVIPNIVENAENFAVSVKNNKRIDHEKVKVMELTVL